MHILCVNALKLLSGFFGDKIWLFLVKTVWQPFAFICPALPTCLVVYVQKSDFHLIKVLCIVIVVKKCRLLCLAQVVFSYQGVTSPDISKVYACIFRPVKRPMRTLHKHISIKLMAKFINFR